MIITLKGCTATKHLGGLNFYSIIVNKSSGITVTLDKTTVSKDTAASTTVSGTLTVASGYTLSSVKITMGGTDKTSSWYNSSTGAITISGITANVTITAVATNNSTGETETPSGGGSSTPTLTWYTTQINQSGLTVPVDTSAAPYGYTDTLCANYYDKPINRIRLKVATAGVISFGICSADRKTIVSTYTISAAPETEVYSLSDILTLSSGQGVWLSKSSDTGKPYCSITADDKSGTFYSKVGTSNLVSPHDKNYSLGLDLGYYG